MKTRRILQILLVFSIQILGCSESNPTLDDSSISSLDQHSGFVLSRIDSIGIEFGDSNYVFGNIIDGDFMPDGKIVLLDVLKDRITMFSQTGEFLTSVGSEGQGPGEFMEPSSIAILSNGDICVADFMNRKLIFFDSDLNYQREISGFTMQSPSIIDASSNGAVVGLQTDYYREDDNIFIGTRLALWTDSPDPETIYDSRYNQPTGSSINLTCFAFATGSDGSVYSAESSQDEYQIIKYTAGGDTAFAVSEPYTRMYRTDEEMNTTHFGYTLDTPGFDSNDRRAISNRRMIDPVRNAISSIHIDGNERLWVATGRGESPSPEFEVYDSTGTHLCTVSTDLPAEMRSGSWRMIFGNNRVLAFDTNPADFSKVIILEISD